MANSECREGVPSALLTAVARLAFTASQPHRRRLFPRLFFLSLTVTLCNQYTAWWAVPAAKATEVVIVEANSGGKGAKPKTTSRQARLALNQRPSRLYKAPPSPAQPPLRTVHLNNPSEVPKTMRATMQPSTTASVAYTPYFREHHRSDESNSEGNDEGVGNKLQKKGRKGAHTDQPTFVTASMSAPEGVRTRWWPADLSRPTLYNLAVTLALGDNLGTKSSRRRTRRRIATSTDDVANTGIGWGDQWHLAVNGQEFYGQGTNIHPFVPDSWASENVLDKASTFYVDNWGDLLIEPEARFDISTFLPPFREVCKNAKPCPVLQNGCLNHLTVVEISRTGLGTLWSHNLLSAQSLTNPAPNDRDIAVVRPYINNILPEDAPHRFFFVGGIQAWHRSVGFPHCLYQKDKLAVVEVFFYFENFYVPMMLPLMCRVHGDSEIELPFRQPVTEQVIPCLNRWKRDPNEFPVRFEIYDVDEERFVPLASVDEPIRIALPLRHLIVIKYEHIHGTLWHPSWAKGMRPASPLGGILADMYPYRFIWPVDLPYPRSRINALSVVRFDRLRGAHVFTPAQGHRRCAVETMNGPEDVDEEAQSSDGRMATDEN
ncbi:uncharacterized protein B0H18DRAFT_959636 [Fomitopsis serialis]|uniref:uncharacterized protein n=1 Tax=Fomitopsis serialis TaxID=139415 RepID=UPI002007C5A9|nr:uncharacterized protein B0H18DRAFT_959636 [Neoantrodia serialis]KAH9914818.1 hypothetical protein B0H18DRAFT_959636 [Neoantrodia serialis]